MSSSLLEGVISVDMETLSFMLLQLALSHGHFARTLRPHHLNGAVGQECPHRTYGCEPWSKQCADNTDREWNLHDCLPLVLNDDATDIPLVEELFHSGNQLLTHALPFLVSCWLLVVSVFVYVIRVLLLQTFLFVLF